MSRSLGALLLAGAIACGGDDEECLEIEQVFVFEDIDGDGFGSTPFGWVCTVEPGFSERPADCDDTDPAVSPAAEEVCDGIDNDCDGFVDEDSPASLWFVDSDGDGFGTGEPVGPTCLLPGPQYVEQPGDCDDAAFDINPFATEQCNGIDDDCDGLVDDDDIVDPSTTQPWFVDLDEDGFGDPTGPVRRACDLSDVLVADATDCDDANAARSPAAQEICNAIDDDCDDLIDDGDPSTSDASKETYFLDADGDGFGSSTLVLACTIGAGAVENSDDCNDDRADVQTPTAWVEDLDQDGFGDTTVLAVGTCFEPTPTAIPVGAPDDCNDEDGLVFPGAAEICGDGLDQDCSGVDCTFAFSYDVADGPALISNPDVFSCVEACEEVARTQSLPFDGPFLCSTSDTSVDRLAFASTFGDASTCTVPVDHEFSLENAYFGGYACGVPGCSVSAFVDDQCAPGEAINHCWQP